MNGAGLVIAVLALVVSVVTFQVNWRASQAAERHGRMPVLIARHAAGAVGVVNVGNGPALNVVIAQGAGAIATCDVLGADLKDFQDGGTWLRHAHLAQLPADTQHWYAWTWADPVIGLTYTDALGHHYTSVSSRYGTKVVDGLEMTHPPLVDLDYPAVVEPPGGA